MRRAVIAAAASLIVACSILTSFDGIEPREVSAPAEAAPDAEAAAPEAGCAPTRWPDPPVGSDTGRDVGELASAVTLLRILDPIAEGKPQGYDLDGLCTCPDRPACGGPKPNEPCDPPDSGIDNVGDMLFRSLAGQGLALDDTGLQMGIQQGQYGIIVRVTGYDGERNDPDVKVAVLNAAAVNGDGGVPRNDGADEWTVDTESLLGTFPAYFSSRAYVVDGVLVAEMLRVVLRARIPIPNKKWGLVELDLRSAHLVARLGARSARGIVLEDGRIAGRIPEAAMLAQGMRSGACRDSGLYEALKPVVCAARDLPVDPAKDGRDQPCDSLSVGFGFTSGPAILVPGSGTRVDELPCPIVPDRCP
ncbi:hypothetical protein BH11MYX4_BH11MYX4_42120 [soil metagenome]